MENLTLVYYQLRCPCVLAFLECVDKVIQQNTREHMALFG